MTKSAIFFVKLYKTFVSPALRRSCRFYPSCSSYAIEALEAYGAVKGVGLILCRLSRCHPLGSSGFDPVPRTPPRT